MEKKKIEKPLTLRIGEFKQELCDLINKYELPAYVLLNEFNEISFSIKERDLQLVNEYNESLKGSEEECKK